MAADPRQRNIRRFTQSADPIIIGWASAKQREIFEYEPFPVCASGAYNCGKTIGIILKLLYLADLYPGFRTLIARNVWDELRKTTMPSFFKFCPKQAYEPLGRRSDTEKILELNNGSSFIWMHLDDADSVSALNGLELNAFFFNQAEDIAEEKFTTALNRLNRWDKVTVSDELVARHTAATGRPWPYIHPVTGRRMPPSYAFLDCNPRGYNHWIYEIFHPDSLRHQEKSIRFETAQVLADGRILKAGDPASYQDLGYRMWEMAMYENKYATPQNLAQAQSMDESWKRTYYHGKWGLHEGQIHEVREASILYPTQAVLSHVFSRCHFHRTMDHGDSAATCVLWWAADGDGNCFCFREYYVENKLISEHRQAVTMLSQSERYVTQFADPSIFSPSMQKHDRRWSVSEEYADVQYLPRENAIYWQRGDNDELGTRNRISEYLRPQGVWELRDGKPLEVPRIHPITKEKGLWPRLFFVRRTEDYPQGCNQAIIQMRSQSREKTGTLNGKLVFSDERDIKVADHAYDCALESTRCVVWDDGWKEKTLGTASKYGWVLTPAGPQPYSGLQCYKNNAPMMTVQFKDRSVTTTPDHLFLTQEGWQEAQSLKSGQTVLRYFQEEFTGGMVMDTSFSNPENKHRAAATFITACSNIIYGLCEVVNVRPAPNSDAWCLTVHHPCQSFLVEGGIVIHNCVRYFIASQPPAPNAVPLKYSAKSFFGQMALAHKFARNRKSIAKLAKREYLKRYG